jgi:predicted hydrolase (HD superfamily)
LNRTEALALLKQNLTNKNLFNHSLAVETVMRRLAAHFEQVFPVNL